jgi:hypothetical protein
METHDGRDNLDLLRNVADETVNELDGLGEDRGDFGPDVGANLELAPGMSARYTRGKQVKGVVVGQLCGWRKSREVVWTHFRRAFKSRPIPPPMPAPMPAPAPTSKED